MVIEHHGWPGQIRRSDDGAIFLSRFARASCTQYRAAITVMPHAEKCGHRANLHEP
jgi:hypothetical protein